MDQERKIPIGRIIGVIGGIAGIASAIWTATWSIYTYRQLMPLNQANVVLLESSEIKHYPVATTGLSSGEKTTDTGVIDSIVPSLKNVGKATAQDVKLIIYGISFDESTGFTQSMKGVVELFADRIVNSLSPDTTANFANIALTTLANESSENKDFRGAIDWRQQVVLVFHLQFTDSITKKVSNRIYFYQHTSGADNLRVLLGSDYLKIKDRLIIKLESDGSDDFLLTHLKNNSQLQ